MTPLGCYPTPIVPLELLSRAGASLWVKRDDLTSPVYGGNKVRKLERVLADARARGASRLVTVGAVGSHHVLATAVFGRRAGFEVEAVLVPQPRTEHVVRNVRADVARGARLFPAPTWAHAPLLLAERLLQPGAYFVPVGGSNLVGAMGYVDAARELAEQVARGDVPEPDVAVVTLGSGGTAAGLAAGLAAAGLRTQVVAVCVAEPAWILRWYTRHLARRCARRTGADPRDAAGRILVETGYRGGGYGHPTPWGAEAAQAAARVGLSVDPTYTAKTLAAGLDLVDRRVGETIVYWHTLSSAPMEPLLEGAPDEADLDPAIRRLLLANSRPAPART